MSAVQDLLHRGPVRLNPPAVMAAVPVWRDPNLRELELCPAGYLFEVEDSDRVVVRPPTGGAPCLDNLLPRFEHQIVATEMSVLAPRQVLEVGGSRFTARWSLLLQDLSHRRQQLPHTDGLALEAIEASCH